MNSKRSPRLKSTRFKEEYKARFPGRDTDSLTDEDLLREVMNTVGKQGRLGEQIKCVVSVSMLTEGWDASTVTHILGVRAFGTQLLCEQVVGRGLRRMSHAVARQTITVDGHPVEFDAYTPEYAEVYGVPFSFIPCSGSNTTPKPGLAVTHVRAIESRSACEITFPRLIGYRYDLQSEQLSAVFGKEAAMVLSTQDLPTKTEMASIIGESGFHTLYGLKDRRTQEIDFRLASLVLEKYFKDDQGSSRPWLFPQLLQIARRWRQECVTCKDNAFPQMLLLAELAHEAAEHIYLISLSATHSGGEKASTPDPAPLRRHRLDPLRRFRHHPPHLPDRPGQMPGFARGGRYWRLGTESRPIPGRNGRGAVLRQEHQPWLQHPLYPGRRAARLPAGLHRAPLCSLARVFVGRGQGEGKILNLILEVSGQARKDKAVKVATAQTLWVPAVNNLGGFGGWAFLEVTDPWDVKNFIRKFVKDYLQASTESDVCRSIIFIVMKVVIWKKIIRKVMVFGAIWCPLNKSKEIAERIREIKVEHSVNPYFEIKWTKVSPVKLIFILIY